MNKIYLFCLVYLTVFLICAHTYELNTKKEELIIVNVSTCDYFEWGCNVLKWKSVAVREENYAVGVTENGISILTMKTRQGKIAVQENFVDLQSSPMDIELFKRWNSKKHRYDVILLAAVEKENYELKYFIINENRTLENIWTWYLRKKVKSLKVFEMENEWNLLIVNDHDEHTTVDLYRLNFDKKYDNLWLTQTIELANPSKYSAMNFFGSRWFLAFTQLDVINIYEYKKERFVHYQNLSSENVDFVNSFNIGYKSYLAFNGVSAGIYRFTKNGLVKEFVSHAILDVADFLLPISVTQYREEVILLVQRSPDHGFHQSLTIVSNGDNFFLHDEMPCLYYGETLNGINCLIGEGETPKGIKGSAMIPFGNNLGILIPRNNNATSALFILEIERRKFQNPVKIQLEKALATKNRLEKMFDDDMAIIGRIKERIKNSVILNKPNNISAPWKIDTLVAPALLKPNSTKSKFKRFAQEEENSFAKRAENIQILTDGIRRNLKELTPDGQLTKFKNLIIEGFVHVKDQSRIRNVAAENVNEQPAQFFFDSFTRKDNFNNTIEGPKIFTNLIIDNVTFETVNGIQSNNLVFNNHSELNIKGDLNFKKTLNVLEYIHVTDKLNDANILEELVEIEKPYSGTLNFENVNALGTLDVKIINEFPIRSNYPSKLGKEGRTLNIEDMKFETLYVSGNLMVKNLNGRDFNDTLSSICLKNTECNLPGHNIFAEAVTIFDKVEINYLNDLKFPEEYVFKTSEKFTKIQGKKWFKNSLNASEIATRGLMNELNIANIVRLSDDQVVFGNFTFYDLEVTEHFDVGPNITGLKTEAFLQNPTLIQANVITSNVNFNALKVDGVITTGEFFNGSYFRSTLDDVVFRTKDLKVINSVKTFTGGLTVRDNAIIASNAINHVLLNMFVTKDTNQVLSVKVLNGNVTFDNLNLLGLYGDVKAAELVREIVKLNGEQYISGTLSVGEELYTKYLQIYKTLNGLEPLEYIFTTENQKFPKLSTLDTVKADEVYVDGRFNGPVENFNTVNFTLSLKENQVIKASYDAKSATIKSLKVKKINGHPYEDLFGLEKYTETISHLILDNKLKVKELNISGNLVMGSVNNVTLDGILNSCAYFGVKLNADVYFQGNVEFSRVNIENFNGVNFEEFTSNVVFKNETTFQIDVPKLYANGFRVTNFIDIMSLNSIPLEAILRKTGHQEFKGPLTIKGDVAIEVGAEIFEFLSEIHMKDLTKTFQVLEGAYKINGDIYFERLAHIENIFVFGLINSKNVTDVLRNLVSIKDDVKISERTIFENVVHMKGDLSVLDDVNGVDFDRFKDYAVLINQDSYIDGLVTFTQPIQITEEIQLESDLLGQFVMEIDLQTWKDDAVYVNEGPIPDAISIESIVVHNFLKTSYINTLDMSTLIPLRTYQDIPKSLYLNQMSIFHDVNVNGLINGNKMQPEMHNTLTIAEDQKVSGPVIFNGNIVVRNKLNTFGFVNGVNFDKIVTTDTDQNLTARYNIAGYTVMTSDLLTSGLLNGINLTDWEKNSIKWRAPYTQRIIKSWRVTENMTFANHAEGKGLVLGLDFRKVLDDVEHKRRYKFEVERDLAVDYNKICTNVQYLVHSTQTQIYKFKYLENMQFIDFENDIENAHYFDHENIDYLLVNQKSSCRALLFTWSRSEFHLVNQIETGRVKQFITVRQGNFLFLVGRDDTQSTHCLIEGSNVWMFVDGDNLLNVFRIENQLLLQESLIPGRFYSLDENYVTEYQIKYNFGPIVTKNRKWKISGENVAFIPRGLETGLAMRNGQFLLKLDGHEPVIEEEEVDLNFEIIAHGNVSEQINSFLPGSDGGDVVFLNVGKARNKTLAAVASHEEMSVKSRLDFIKIYDNILTGSLFHKVSTYKPSSLMSMEFGNNGETLLVFLENQKALKIFDYKGIEGFKHRTSVKTEGQKLMLMQLRIGLQNKRRNVLGVINKNRLSIVNVAMDGDQVEIENLQCTL